MQQDEDGHDHGVDSDAARLDLGMKQYLFLESQRLPVGERVTPEDEINDADQDNNAKQIACYAISIENWSQAIQSALKARQETDEQVKRVDQEIIGEAEHDSPMQQAGQRSRFQSRALCKINRQRGKRAARNAIEAQLASPAPDNLKHLLEAGITGAKRKQRQQNE